MRDLFTFTASGGQDLTDVTSGGVVSNNVWNLEVDDSARAMETDGQILGWINVTFRAGNSGATEGLWIDVISDDAAALTTADTQIILGAMYLNDVQLTAAAGKTYSIGVNMAGLQTFLGLWFRADSTSLATSTTKVDAAFNISSLFY